MIFAGRYRDKKLKPAKLWFPCHYQHQVYSHLEFEVKVNFEIGVKWVGFFTGN